MAPYDSLQVSAKYTEINVKVYAPQVLTAANTLATYPTSKIAKENLEGNFFTVYKMYSKFYYVWNKSHKSQILLKRKIGKST